MVHGFLSEIRKSGRDGGALSDGFESGKRENRKRRQRALEPLGQEAANPVKSRGHGRRGSRRRRHEAKAWQVEKTGDLRGAPMHNRQSARVGKRSRIAPTIPRELATLKEDCQQFSAISQPGSMLIAYLDLNP